MALVKFLKETYGKSTLLDSIKAGGWKAALDGTLAQATLVHGPGATLVGQDQFGNKYYERMTEQYGRHRWVMFGDLNWPSGQEPSTVPPEWHGWLHCTVDKTPSQAGFLEPIYHVNHSANRTSTMAKHAPKGAWRNPQKRGWGKVDIWMPPASA